MGLRPKPPARKGFRSRLDQALFLTIIAGLVLLLLVGVVFSVAYGSQEIADTAAGLHVADESLRSATVVRAQLAMAIQAAAVDRRFGTFSGPIITTSLQEAEQALGDLQDGLASLTTVSGSLDRSRQFVATASEVLALLRAENDVGAQKEGTADLQSGFEQLAGELTSIRDDYAAQLQQSDQFLGLIGNLARFLVAFLIPSAVILIYRELVRRQHRQSELETRLASERALGKAREEFIANASHELRTPLTGILGMAMILEDDPLVRQSEMGRELVGLIISEAGDLNRMVEDLLTTARLDAGALHFTYEDVQAHAEVEEVVEPMRRSGAQIEVDCQPAVVRLDRLRFRQVVRNLLSNARKYGGPHIRVVGRARGDEYVCWVADDGAGMPPELQTRLFERFVHQGGGTATKGSVGLGLSIVRALTEAMGGTVGHRRENGETRFILRLPLAGAELPIAAAPVSMSTP